MTRAPSPPATTTAVNPATPVSRNRTPATPPSNTSNTTPTPTTPDQYATESRMLKQLVNHRDDIVIFVEHAPKASNNRGAKCRLHNCGKLIDPGTYRITLHPGMLHPDGDFYHIRCFEKFCDLSKPKFLRLLTPLTRNTFEPRQLKPSQLLSGGVFVNSGAERLIYEFKSKRSALLPPPPAPPTITTETKKDIKKKIKKDIKSEEEEEEEEDFKEIKPKPEEDSKAIKSKSEEPEIKPKEDDDSKDFKPPLPPPSSEKEDYTDILQNAGSTFYVPPPRPKTMMSKREYKLYLTKLCIWESECEGDDWSLFEEFLTDERVDLENRNGLSGMLTAWLKGCKVAAQEYNHTEANQKLRDGFGENGVQGIIRLSETILN